MKAPLSVLNEWVRAGLELALLLWIGAVLGEPRKKLTSRQKRHVLWIRWGLAVALPIGAWRLIAEGILWLDWFFVPVVAVIDSFLNEAEDKMVEDPKPLDQEMAGTL